MGFPSAQGIPDFVDPFHTVAGSWGAQPRFNFSDFWFPIHPSVACSSLPFRFIHFLGMHHESWYPPLAHTIAEKLQQYSIHVAARYALQGVAV